MARTQTVETATSLHGTTHDVRVDEAIAKAAAFAQPILRHLRELIHEAVADATEEIKWGRPFFTVNGTMFCYIAAFNKHCSLGFWSPEMTTLLQKEGVDGTRGSGSVGKIAALEDLPPRADLLRYFHEAAQRARSGVVASSMKTRRRVSSKAPLSTPPELVSALANSGIASCNFDGLPPSCKREYIDWIAGAKRPETRQRRVAQTITMVEAGKRFNEQYRSTPTR